MKLMIAGDWHANMGWSKKMIEKCGKLQVPAIMQLGDWGHIWNGSYTTSLHKLSRILKFNGGIKLYFLPGNHENHDLLEKLCLSAPQTEEGFYELAEGIYYTGRYNQWQWDNNTFTAVGGAYSIDKHWREPGRSWWSQELLAPYEVQRIVQLPKTDVLFSHDSPTTNPFGLKPDVDSHINRQRMSEIADHLEPKLWFHGHYHRNDLYEYKNTLVQALDMDDTGRAAYAFIDTATLNGLTEEGLHYDALDTLKDG